jgi:hypothetical protein
MNHQEWTLALRTGSIPAPKQTVRHAMVLTVNQVKTFHFNKVSPTSIQSTIKEPFNMQEATQHYSNVKSRDQTTASNLVNPTIAQRH